MPGLSTTGSLSLGTGLNWLDGGLGTPGLTNPIIIPETPMLAEDGSSMITETDDRMVTEA